MEKYKPYPEYKDSGVEWLGEIPAHWNRSQLKHISSINMGQSPNSSDCNIDGIGDPFLQGNAEFGARYPKAKQYCSVAKKIALEGDLLFSVRAPVGAMNFANTSYGIGRGLCALRFNSKVEKVFLWWLIFAHKNQLDAIATGSTFEAVSAEQIANLIVGLPLFPEQTQVANFLDHETAKIDRLIEKQERLIELLAEKRQAVISHAVTKGLNPDAPMKDSGVEWLGEVPEHWKVGVKIGWLAEKSKGSFVNGPFGSDLLAHELKKSGIPVIYIRDIKESGYKRKSEVFVTVSKARQLDVCRVVSGDILIAKVGTPPGVACVYPAGEEDAIVTQDVVRIRVNKTDVSSDYLKGLINSNYGIATIDNISIESTRKRFALGDFKGLKFVLPPYGEQVRIATYLEEVSKKSYFLLDQTTKVVSILKERRTALISAAVTGKIDLRDWQHPQEEN